MKQKLTKEVIDFINENANQVWHNESVYYYIPRWFKQTSDNEVEAIPFDKLPQNLIDAITWERENPGLVTKIDASDFLKKYPLTPDEAFKK